MASNFNSFLTEDPEPLFCDSLELVPASLTTATSDEDSTSSYTGIELEELPRDFPETDPKSETLMETDEESSTSVSTPSAFPSPPPCRLDPLLSNFHIPMESFGLPAAMLYPVSPSSNDLLFHLGSWPLLNTGVLTGRVVSLSLSVPSGYEGEKISRGKKYSIMSCPPPTELSYDDEPETKTIDLHQETKITKKRTRESRKTNGHDSTPVMEYIETAMKIDNFQETGMSVRHGLMVYDPNIFFQWVRTQKLVRYREIKQSSFYDKFDISRPVNRVNRDEVGPIKFLKIEKGKLTNYHWALSFLNEMEELYPSCKLKLLTHRDWKLLPKAEFYYYAKKSCKV